MPSVDERDPSVAKSACTGAAIHQVPSAPRLCRRHVAAGEHRTPGMAGTAKIYRQQLVSVWLPDGRENYDPAVADLSGAFVHGTAILQSWGLNDIFAAAIAAHGAVRRGTDRRFCRGHFRDRWRFHGRSGAVRGAAIARRRPGQYAHVAIGTSAATIIITSIRSLRSHAKRGAVEFMVLKTWAPWIIFGDALGVLLAGHVDGRILTLIFATGVLLMSLNFLLPGLGGHDHRRRDAVRHAAGCHRRRTGHFFGAARHWRRYDRNHGDDAAWPIDPSRHRDRIGYRDADRGAERDRFRHHWFARDRLPWGSLGYVNLPAAVAIASMSVLTAPLGVAAAHSLQPAR